MELISSHLLFPTLVILIQNEYFGHHNGNSLQLISWCVLWFLYPDLYLGGQYYHRIVSSLYTSIISPLILLYLKDLIWIRFYHDVI